MSAPLIADRIAHRVRWEDVDPEAVRSLVEIARKEDLDGWGLARSPEQRGDVTSQSIERGEMPATASLVARENLVICGLPLVQLVLDAYGAGASFAALCEDGESCQAGKVLGTLKGSTRTLLEAERTLLNFLQKLSGVASITHDYIAAMGSSTTRLLDTRKTTPGYRVLEKYAVACGGGFNHRIGLFDRIMLKDNHLAADLADSGQALASLVKSARRQWPQLVIELEVDLLDQIGPALDSGADVFLLDNFSMTDLTKAVDLIGNRAATEASGGITLDNLPALADAGLDFISTGATVHKSKWKDIALDWN